MGKLGGNLVIVHAGLNDVLRGRGHNLGRQIEAGVRKLREAAEKVHIVMCTIPEVQRQAKVIERGVVEANWVIGQLGRKLGYQVMEVNREVYQGGTAQPFDLGGLHCGTLTGWQIGEWMGGRARAFLGEWKLGRDLNSRVNAAVGVDAGKTRWLFYVLASTLMFS